jgi:hypothetical protein
MPRHLGIAALLVAALVTPAHALLRSPQVPVTGVALQSLLNAQGQAIDVATDQQQATGFTGLFLTQPATYFFVYSFGKHQDDLVVFDTGNPTSPLYVISPAGNPAGWFTEVSFRDAPMGMVVSLFDAASTFQGSTSYLGLGFSFMGLATSGPGGVFYPYDVKNPGQRAQVLAFLGTGAHQGSTWLCGENQTPANGGDDDFADAVFLLEYLNVTPVQRTTWGTLKQRFR